MRKVLLTILLFNILTIACNAIDYSGIIFVDANKNGKCDKGEKVMSNVSISDGLNVVKSDKNGKFALPGHSKAKFIFITTPSGYKTNNAHYQKIESNKESYDFGLYPLPNKIEKEGEHKFIHLADTEIFNTENHEDWISTIKNYSATEKVAFIMHTGDICYDKGLREHIKLMNTDNMDCPVFYGIGNHDLVEGDYGEQLFESIYGPVYYSFDVGNVHYIMTPMLSGDYKPSYTKEEVYKWLKNDLALVEKGKPVIVFSHDLLTDKDEFKYGSETEFVNLNDHNLKAWIYGHWHINLMKKQGEIYSICTSTPDKGGIDHSAANFRVIDIDKSGNIKSHLQYPYVKQSIVINSIHNNKIVERNNSVFLSVNTYDSDSKTKEVEYSLYNNGKQLTKGKLKQSTDWNWSDEIKISPKLVGNNINIKVKSVFNNGKTSSAEEYFTLKGSGTKIIEELKDWTTMLGNTHHNGNTDTNIKPPLSIAWINNIGANIFMSSPIIYNGNIYVASVDENLKGEAHIYALDGVSGELLWKYQVKNSIKNSIVACDNNIFAQDIEGNLYAVNSQNGKLAWEKKLNMKGLPATVEGLTATNGIVYAGTGIGLSAHKAEDGSILWQNQDWNQGEGATNTLTLANTILISGSQWGALYANNASTGEMIWTNNTNGLSDRGASASVHNGLIYIISRKSFFIIDLASGRIIARKELPVSVDVTSTPLLTDNEIIFGSAEAGLVALDNQTLDIKWQFETGKSLIYTAPYTRSPFATIETSPILSGDFVYFGASDGYLYGINVNDGSQVFEFNVGAPILNTLAVSGNNVFVSDFAGNVYALTSIK